LAIEERDTCNSDTVEVRGRIGEGFGVVIFAVQPGKRGCLAICQRPIVKGVCIGMIRAFLWDREPPKGYFLTAMLTKNRYSAACFFLRDYR
jgi:hypothetical protein